MKSSPRTAAWALLIGPLTLTLLASAGVGGDAKAKKEKSLAEIAPRAAPAPTPKTEYVEQAVRKGVDFLVKNQNKNGSWGTPELKGGVAIYASVPGSHQAFQAAVTAMCITALHDIGDERPEVKKSLERAETWLIEHLPKVRRADPGTIYNVWTHCYGIQALVHMHQASDEAERKTKLMGLIHGQIGFLQRYESVDKGWGYYDTDIGTQRPAASSTSFCTAAILVALHDAKAIGAKVPSTLVEGAIQSLHRQRLRDGSYLYGEYLKYRPTHPINLPGGSLGRSQACNLALRLWKDEKVTDAAVAAWLDRFFARNGWLDMARKTTIPHESFFAVAGYFFYFGHYYTGRLIDFVPEAERAYYRDHLAAVLLARQSKDGSWWDYPFYNYHQQYGTAFGLMTLAHVRKTR